MLGAKRMFFHLAGAICYYFTNDTGLYDK
ncbi:MAG: hypothetical protein RL742_1746, partial [Bacteroidota bacterium]